MSEAARHGYLTTSVEGEILSHNPSLWELWGIPAGEAAAIAGAGKGALERFLGAVRRRVVDPDAADLLPRSPEEVATGDVPLVDGRVLERYSAPLRDSPGRVTGRMCFFREVTAARRAEAEIRERARQQAAVARLARTAIDAAHLDPVAEAAVSLVSDTLRVPLCGIFEAAPGKGGFVLGAGRGFRELRAGSRVDGGAAALLGRALLAGAAVPAEGPDRGRLEDDLRDREQVRCGLAVAVRGKDRPFGVLAAWSREARAFAADEVHFLETVASVLGEAVARHQAEGELRERERQLAAVVENSLDAILIVDAQGRVVDANPAACRLWGRAREDLLGTPIESGVEPGRAEEIRRLRRLLLDEGRFTRSLDLRRPGEPTRNLELSAVAHILPGRHLLTLRDVTERRQIQGRLALADRMASVGTLAAGVAHELNNPLAYVSANLSFVAESLAGRTPGDAGSPSTPEMIDALREAREGAERMRAIIRDLKTFSRRDDAEEGPVDLQPVVESCIDMAWNEIKHRAVLVKDFAAVPPVPGNVAKLGQVFLNIVVNAAQAIPEGHRERNEIAISIRPAEPDRVSVEIRDTGGGIPPDNLARIFDPFFTTRQQHGGTGLGLSICHNIVSDLGGEIEVESEIGRGSLFRVLLPAGAGARPPSPVRLPSGAEHPRGRVLVVDDEPLVGTAIRRALDGEHEITVYSDARPALARIAAGARFDVLLCDLLMPEMSGMEFHREVGRIDPDLARRTLFLTGGAFTEQTRAFLQQEGVRCLEKPFKVEVLRDAVRARLVPGAARR